MRVLMTTVMLFGSAAVLAQAPEAAAPTGFGSATQGWLDLQTSGASSVSDPRPMPGEVASRVYERYLKSYSYPIPQQFPRQTFVGGSSSGSGTNSGTAGSGAGTSGASGGGY